MNLDYYYIEFKNIIEFNNSFFNNTNSNNLIKYYNQLFGLESNITNKIIELNPKIIIRLINNNSQYNDKKYHERILIYEIKDTLGKYIFGNGSYKGDFQNKILDKNILYIDIIPIHVWSNNNIIEKEIKNKNNIIRSKIWIPKNISNGSIPITSE